MSMSFSKQVKRELCAIREQKASHQGHIVYGMLYGTRFSGDAFTFHAENEAVFTLFSKLWKGKINKKSDKQYTVPYDPCLLPHPEDRAILLPGDDSTAGLFLRGVFLTCGALSDPNTEYHLELTPPSADKCKALSTLLREHGMDIRQSKRKSGDFLYLKESEAITDFLTYIGAGNHAMELMNVKIYKEVRNNVNRAVNCESANIAKTARAAGKQIMDIEYIYAKKGADFLPPELEQVAKIRMEHVEMSLSEIGNACNPKLSRSGVNHRLRKISAIADKLRGIL